MALYRDCRPARFAEIVGQEHVTGTLRNAVTQGRLAHAYLFCGPRGTGKTTTARVLAKALNCPDVREGEPCGECPTCRSIALGEGVDVVEMDAASNRGIDEIRSLRERVRLAPVGGRYKVYVIDEVHMLTTEAFNALLKTLEEPPRNVVFILCTTEVYRVPATIISRCQRFDFHPLATEAIARYLNELVGRRGLAVEPAAAKFIARVATGSLRDALSVLDQCLAYAPAGVTLAGARGVVGALDGSLLVGMTGALLAGDAARVWATLETLLSGGRDPREVARGLAAHLRDLLLFRLAGRNGELIGPGADEQEELERQAAAAPADFLYAAIDALTGADSEMRHAPQPRLALEARLLRLCVARSPVPAAGGEVCAAAPPGEEPPQCVKRGQHPGPEKKQSAEHAGGPRSRVEPERPAEPRSEPPVEPDVPHDLAAVWKEVLSELPVPTAGLLAGSSLVWEDGRAWIAVPAGRDVVAEHLSAGGQLRSVSEVLSRHLSRRVQVGIRLQTVTGGLFGGPDGAPAAGRGRAAARSRSQSRAGGSRPARAAPQDGEADLSKQAEAMFAAEEVDKGDERGDEPW